MKMTYSLNNLDESHKTCVEEMSDDEIIKNSQDISKLQKKKEIIKKVFTKSKSPVSRPKKDSLFNSPQKIVDAQYLDEIDNISIKDEVPDMYENVDNEAIEMMHNVNTILLSSQSSNVLQFAPIIFDDNIEETIKQEIESDEMQLEISLNDEIYEDDKLEVPQMAIKKEVHLEELNSNRIKTRSQNNSIDAGKDESQIKFFNNTSTNKCNKKMKKKKSKFVNMDDNLFSKEMKQKLEKLKIKLQHEVPPQHDMEFDTGTTTLNESQVKKFESYGPLKKGQYSKSEIKTIKQNWNDFCKIHNWNEKDVKPFLQLKHNYKYYLNKSERKKFIQFLANGLPWRNLRSVYWKFKDTFNTNVNAGKFSLKEDKLILKYMSKKSNDPLQMSSTEVANMLNRKLKSINHRFQILTEINSRKNDNNDNDDDNDNNNNDNNDADIDGDDDDDSNGDIGDDINIDNDINSDATWSKIKTSTKLKNTTFKNETLEVKWSYGLVKIFIDALVQLTCTNLNNLKSQIIDQNIWNKLEKITRVNQKVLQNFWYLQLHMQIFCPSPIYLNDLKIKLIQYFFKEKINTVEDIKWEIVCLSFDGMTSDFLSKLFYHLIKIGETEIDSSNIKENIQYLYHEYIPKLEEKSTDIILPKLCITKNKIISVDKGTEKKTPNRITRNPFDNADLI